METRGEVTPAFSLAASLSYGAASMAMVFVNKAVLMQYPHSMTLLTFQQLVTALLIYFGRVMGYTRAKGLEMPIAKKLLPVSLFYNANVAFALASLKGVNIPMYIALKRLTPLAVLITGFVSGKGRPSTQVSLSVLLTAAGVIVAALGDFSFDFFGYSMALISVFFQTLGFVLLGGVQVHALNVTGLVINTAGGVWYSLAKYQQKKNRLPRMTSDIEAHRK